MSPIENNFEENNLKISFVKYRTKESEIQNLKIAPLRKIIEFFILSGTSKHDFKNMIKQKGDYISRNDKTYFSLYKNLSPDDDVYEYKIGNSERMFYSKYSNIIYVLLFKNKHFEK